MRTQKRYALYVLTAAVGILLLAVPASADPDEEYKKMAGYVDFEQLGLVTKFEPSIEVFLKGPLLKLAREAVKHDEPDLAGALDNIKLIRINVFDLGEIEGFDSKDLSEKTKKLATNLEKKGWEIAVRVRERDENVYIYLLPGKNDDIDGLVVMAVEDDDQAVFVNIVGTIDPEQIGRVGHSIHIDGVDLDYLDEYYENRKNEEKKQESKKRTNR
jgi:hypothetical protein